MVYSFIEKFYIVQFFVHVGLLFFFFFIWYSKIVYSSNVYSTVAESLSCMWYVWNKSAFIIYILSVHFDFQVCGGGCVGDCLCDFTSYDGIAVTASQTPPPPPHKNNHLAYWEPMGIDQGFPTCGPQATCGLQGNFVRPVKSNASVYLPK